MFASTNRGVIGLAVVAWITLVPAASSAQDFGPQLRGTWLARVTRVDPPAGVAPTFLSLMTYSKDGAVLEESNTNAIRSLAQGQWEHLGNRRFTRTMILFRFNAARVYVGLQRITAEMRLNNRGDMFRAEGKAEIFDLDGKLVSTLYSQEEGRRCGFDATTGSCFDLAHPKLAAARQLSLPPDDEP